MWNGTIRPATIADAPAITDIYNEAILTTTATFDTEPKSVADRIRWLENRDARHPVLVAIACERVIGWACLNPWSDRLAYRETAETSFYVAAEFRGQGVGRQLKAAIIDEARRHRFFTLIARVAEGSEASLHLNQSFGFEMVGTLRKVGLKFGRRLSVHILQKMLSTPDGTFSA